VTSDSVVPRDIYYTGSIVKERCTIVSRVAPNFFRFGSFEIFHRGDPEIGERSGPSEGLEDLKRQLYEHILSVYYPEISQSSHDLATQYRLLFLEIVHRTIKLLTL
jgi:serine/tyrosine/threonine adenylyltransferase